MTMPTRLAILLLVAAVAAMPAQAATTSFGSSVFSETSVLNAPDGVARPDGLGATVTNGGQLTLFFDKPLTGADLVFNFLASGGVSVVAVSIGEVIGGVATFSGEFVLVDFGAGASLFADLTAACAGVSATGCSLLRLRNAATISGPGFIIDGVSGVSNAPEPQVWALMIAGFIGVGWRLKAMKASGVATSPRALAAA